MKLQAGQKKNNEVEDIRRLCRAGGSCGVGSSFSYNANIITGCSTVDKKVVGVPRNWTEKLAKQEGNPGTPRSNKWQPGRIC